MHVKCFSSTMADFDDRFGRCRQCEPCRDNDAKRQCGFFEQGILPDQVLRNDFRSESNISDKILSVNLVCAMLAETQRERLK